MFICFAIDIEQLDAILRKIIEGVLAENDELMRVVCGRRKLQDNVNKSKVTIVSIFGKYVVLNMQLNGRRGQRKGLDCFRYL